jgi:ribosomal-protein-alanine N-acetyltransferase
MINLEAPGWWEQLPILSGPTLHLREVEHEDIYSLFELLNDPKVSQYISPPPPTPEAFNGFVEWAHSQRRSGVCVCFAVVPQGLRQAIGLFQIRALDSSLYTAEWGFAMGAAFWGTGLFEEAAALVVEFAFKTLGVQRLEARAVTLNGRGNGALEKLGAKGEAVLRKAFKRQHSQFLWAIVAEEWTPPQVKHHSAFDATRLKHQIQRAVAQRPAQAPRAPHNGTATPFPFFLTDPFNDSSEDD